MTSVGLYLFNYHFFLFRCYQTHQFNWCLHNHFMWFKHDMASHSAATMKHTKRYSIFYIIQCLTWETGITLEVLAVKSSYKNPVITDLTHQRSFRENEKHRKKVKTREKWETHLFTWRRSVALLEGVLASLLSFWKSIWNWLYVRTEEIICM